MMVSYIALDIGQKRIGVAVANSIARIAAPLPALQNDGGFHSQLQTVIEREQASLLIVGWPRSLDGRETEQTRYVGSVIKSLETAVQLPIIKQDEAVTSVTAETELQQRGKAYTKADIDSLSAVYILEDYLQGQHAA